VILVALLLLSLGAADLVRRRLPFSLAIWIATATGVLVFLFGADGVGLDWWWAPIAVVAISGWLAATREDIGSHRAGYWALGALAAVIAAAVVAGPALGTPTGALVDWYAALPYPGLVGIPFTASALTVGGVVFLFETSNVIVRLALRGERSSVPHDAMPDAAVPATVAPPRRWWRRRSPEPATTHVPDPTSKFTELKGGRFIGPLERVFLLALVLTGQFTAVAAVIAAKGIVRFPEISKDDTGGSKAEYFLVGSFASWALVVVVGTLVTLVT
jgi:hypothetical protein